MWSIYQRELSSFLSSAIGYLAVGVFLTLLGLLMFVFPQTSILEYNFATLDQLFGVAPLVFLVLLPAVTMRTFAEERQRATLEVLLTRPPGATAIVTGKFLACLTLAVVAILPTLLYYYTVYELGSPRGNVDSGAIAGSYAGLIALAAIFCAVGLLASSLTQNQIVAFLLAGLLCFLLHYGFEFLSALPVFLGSYDGLVQSLGIEAHYLSISRGLVVFSDVVYFVSVTVYFLALTVLVIQNRAR